MMSPSSHRLMLAQATASLVAFTALRAKLDGGGWSLHARELRLLHLGAAVAVCCAGAFVRLLAACGARPNAPPSCALEATLECWAGVGWRLVGLLLSVVVVCTAADAWDYRQLSLAGAATGAHAAVLAVGLAACALTLVRGRPRRRAARCGLCCALFAPLYAAPRGRASLPRATGLTVVVTAW
jgi:hypothetical protein